MFQLILLIISVYPCSFVFNFPIKNTSQKIKTYTYPARMFRRVDLPAPEGPIIAVNSPDRNFPFTDFNSCRHPAIKLTYPEYIAKIIQF